MKTFQSIRGDVSDVDAILAAPETQDEGVWKYEHLRQFSMELNGLAVALQGECQPETWWVAIKRCPIILSQKNVAINTNLFLMI